jgi:hypothetical protein
MVRLGSSHLVRVYGRLGYPSLLEPYSNDAGPSSTPNAVLQLVATVAQCGGVRFTFILLELRKTSYFAINNLSSTRKGSLDRTARDV